MPWTTLTIEEFKTWLGLYLLMGIVQQPSLMGYWNQSTLTKTPGIAAVMTRTRFLQILRYLHFVDNESEVAKLPKDSPDYEKLYKIRDLLNIIRRNIQGAQNHERKIAIDETLVKFKGRVAFRQFLTSKPSRFGVKNFTLFESSSGYVWDLLVYTGKTGHDPEKGVAYHVVMKLLQGLEGKHYNIFVDNWYSSPALFLDLAKEKTRACGTVRAGRKGLPGDIMNIKDKEIKSMKRGQCVFRQKSRLIACTWKDNKFVYLLTTKLETRECSTVTRAVKEKEYSPKSVEQKKDMPGSSYIQKILNFCGAHYQRGELYLESLKGECAKSSLNGQPCTECTFVGWISPHMIRIPRPVSDVTKLQDYHTKMCLNLARLKVMSHALLMTGSLDITSKKCLTMEV